MPQKFGRYTLLKSIGRGGMGQIYLAASRTGNGLGKLCAIKTILRGRSFELSQRFRDEGWLLVSMKHANVVDVFEMGRVGLQFYLAMEHVEGKDLGHVLMTSLRQRRLLPIPAALYAVREILEALIYCHRHTDEFGADLSLIHRDVSPGNVLVSYDGRVKLADFGLAYSTRKLAHTQPDVVLGKMGYMAPERLVGPDVDQRADIFSTGVVLFELLSGQRYAPAERPEEYLRQIQHRSKARVSAYRRGIPRALERLVIKATNRDPRQRFGSALEMHDAVQRILSVMGPSYGARQLARDVMEPTFDAKRERHQLVRLLRDVQAEGDLFSQQTRPWEIPEAKAVRQAEKWRYLATEVDGPPPGLARPNS